MPEKITDTRKRETQFGIRSRPHLGGDDVGFRKCGLRGIGNASQVLRLGPATEQDAEAHTVGCSVQQCLAGIEAMACLIEFGLMGVQ